MFKRRFSYNPHIPNIDAISGALFTLRIQYEYTQTQCEEGARHDIDIWYMGITNYFQKKIAIFEEAIAQMK